MLTSTTVNLTRAARRAERIPMPTIPKRVQIETEPGLGKRDICLSIFFPVGCTDFASVRTDTNGSTHVVIALDEPAAMREIAQMLRGAADGLVDRALGIEQPQNFAAAEVAK